MKRLLWISLPVLAAALLWVGAASAQQPTPSDDEVNAIARQLFCPVCENTPLDVCPTEACHQWRELIRQMLAEGRSEGYIKQYFVDNYGARVLSEPPRTGLNWLAYIVPPAAFLGGLTLLFLAFRSWRRTAKASSAAPSTQPGTGPSASLGTGPSASLGTGPSASLGTGPSDSLGTGDEYAARLEEELRKRRE